MSKDFFPPRPESRPTVYAYEDTNPQYAGLLKWATRTWTRRTASPSSIRRRGRASRRTESSWKSPLCGMMGRCSPTVTYTGCSRFIGVKNPEGEWFRCTAAQVKVAIIAVRTGQLNEENRSLDFAMRPEQKEAVEKTAAYFASWRREKGNRNKPPHFLWNAKMRFGKTFAAYQLAKKMGWRKVSGPDIQACRAKRLGRGLEMSRGFQGLAVHFPGGLSYDEADKKKPFVCFWFVSGLPWPEPKHWRHQDEKRMGPPTNWDCVILDEYHYGAWRREREGPVLRPRTRKRLNSSEGEGIEDFDEDIMPITTDAYLYLVRNAIPGYRLRGVHRGANLQLDLFGRATRQSGTGKARTTPMPPTRMVLLTYQLPDAIREIAKQGEFNEFDLNVFFSAEGIGDKAKFKYEDEVQKWLDLIRGFILRRPPLTI